MSLIDTLTTSIFVPQCGLWLKKNQHWILWIIGDIISVPLYIYKGLFFTSIQYLILLL